MALSLESQYCDYLRFEAFLLFVKIIIIKEFQNKYFVNTLTEKQRKHRATTIFENIAILLYKVSILLSRQVRSFPADDCSAAIAGTGLAMYKLLLLVA